MDYIPGGSPDINIVAPLTGSTLLSSESVTIEASASDDSVVTRVQFFVDGEPLGESSEAPYQVIWLEPAPGDHELVAVAIDDDQTSSVSALVTVSVCADTDADGTCDGITPPPPPSADDPVVLVLEAEDNGEYGYRYGPGPDRNVLLIEFDSTVSQTLWFSANGFDIGRLEPVVVELNGVPLGILTRSKDREFNGGDRFQLDASLVIAGTNHLRVIQTNINRKWGVTELLVTAIGNIAPDVSIVTPLDGSEYLEGEVIAMEILASDDGVVDRIELFSNGVLINEFTQAPYQYEWSNVPVGSYGLTAVAYDDQLNSSSSQPVTIVVCPDADGDGACDEFVPPPPPPPADAPVLLTLEQPDNGEYGDRYGPGPDRDQLLLEFDSASSQTLWFSVVGFDIGRVEAVTVELNGQVVGQLMRSKDGQLNEGDRFQLDASLVIAGTNQLRITQTKTGRRWGVTDLLVTAAGNAVPEVSIVTPQDDTDYLPGEVLSITIAASDEGGIQRVELYANGLFLNEMTEAPYEYSWTNVPVGTYELTAVAYDDQLDSGTSQPVTVAVCPDTNGDGACDEFVPPPPPPPADAPIVLTLEVQDQGDYGNRYGPGPDRDVLLMEFDSASSQTLWLEVTGFDIGRLESVIVSLNGTDIGQLSRTKSGAYNAGDRFQLDASLVAAGTNELRITPGSARWKWGVTDLLVTALGNVLPAVSIAMPSDGVEYLPGEAISVEIMASDGGGIDRVELYANGQLLDASSQAPYLFEWTNVPVGTYEMTAVAYDNELDASTSQPVTIVVCPDADGDGACDEFVPPPPPPPADEPIELLVNELNTGEYGSRFGLGPDRDELLINFVGTGQPLWFSVKGYDIGRLEPVLVILNGVEIGQLKRSPDGDFNEGDSFELGTGLLDGAINELKIVQTRAGRRWGVTDMLVFE